MSRSIASLVVWIVALVPIATALAHGPPPKYRDHYHDPQRSYEYELNEKPKEPVDPIPPTEKKKKTYELIQVHVIHRHGDRTPITPMKDESLWAEFLPPNHVLDKISEGTRLVYDADNRNTHQAGGRGVFGKLTQLGLMQMVELGSSLREELFLENHGDDEDAAAASGLLLEDEHGYYKNRGRLFTPDKPLHPDQLQVISTDFPRTIQSVRALLVGLFPHGYEYHEDSEKGGIEIDIRHTNSMIPDPTKRHTKEQEELERTLAMRPHLVEKEQEMKDLAVRATKAVRHLLADDAYDVCYGIAEKKENDKYFSELKSEDVVPLPWGQLAELTKCLRVRDMLPPSISHEDQEAISKHTAWRWFEHLRHPRLGFLAMNHFVRRMLHAATHPEEHPERKPLHIYSAHDSSLIGLMSVLKLEQPNVWPEYGSYLKMEIYKDEEGEKHVRFSLNGQVLRSSWVTDGSGEGEPVAMIPLEKFVEAFRANEESILDSVRFNI